MCFMEDFLPCIMKPMFTEKASLNLHQILSMEKKNMK